MKSNLEMGLRSFQLKVVRGKLKALSCKVLPDLSCLLSTRPICGGGGLEEGAGGPDGALERAQPRAETQPWLPHVCKGSQLSCTFSRKVSKVQTLMWGKEKANALPEYYRKPGSIKNNGYLADVSYQKNNYERS